MKRDFRPGGGVPVGLRSVRRRDGHDGNHDVAGTMTVDGTTVMHVKGSKFRSESKVMGQEILLLGDGSTKQVWKVDQATKQFEPFDPSRRSRRR